MRLNCGDELIRNVGPARFCFTLNDTIMKSPVLSLYYLLLAIFLFAGCPIEQLMAQMNTDTTRYITIEGLVQMTAKGLSSFMSPCRVHLSEP